MKKKVGYASALFHLHGLLLSQLVRRLRFGLFVVCLHVKLPEQDQHVQHYEHLHAGQPALDGVVVDDVAGMRHADDKLRQLHLGNVLLEWARQVAQSHQVVPVHEDVDEGVGQGTEVSVPARSVLAHQEPRPQDQDVMPNVQERQLLLFLTSNHKHRVQELHVLVYLNQYHLLLLLAVIVQQCLF